MAGSALGTVSVTQAPPLECCKGRAAGDTLPAMTHRVAFGTLRLGFSNDAPLTFPYVMKLAGTNLEPISLKLSDEEVNQAS